MDRTPAIPQPEPLRAPHQSVRGKLRKPRNMDRMSIQVEVREAIDKLTLEIFTDMANAGYPFYQCLTAIYVSGVEHAIAIMEEKNEREGHDG